MSLESSLIIFLACLILVLDLKVWMKFDRMSNFFLRERQDVVDRIQNLLERIEVMERGLAKWHSKSD